MSSWARCVQGRGLGGPELGWRAERRWAAKLETQNGTDPRSRVASRRWGATPSALGLEEPWAAAREGLGVLGTGGREASRGVGLAVVLSRVALE